MSVEPNPVSAGTRERLAPAQAVLRAAALVAEGREVPPEIASAARPDSNDLRALDGSVFRAEVDRVLCAKEADRGLDFLEHAGALAAVLPEVQAMVGFADPEFRHKDVWKHTKQVVCQAEARIEVRWAALLHDVGKVKTRKISPEGEVHFFGHCEVGASMFDKIAQRVPFAEAMRVRLRFLILHHLRANQYDPGWTDSAVRRFDKAMGEHLIDLLDLSRADITTKRVERRQKGLRQIDELWARVQALRTADAKEPALPKGIGEAIIRRFSLKPSPRIGEIRRAIEEAVERGDLDRGQDFEYYLAWAADHVATGE